ncbi:MAG: bifunctional UDP-N-acetylglucosamine diphosphorylase/glucosamine-1-phosphate N-acetyltransferase GlmU, partial [Oceanobacter sp.]
MTDSAAQPNNPTSLELAIITLAAGKGSRMKSDLPKVLHALAGKPMLRHVLDSAAQLDRAHQQAHQHVVIGHGAEQVQNEMSDLNITWALQTEQKGTGHAVAQAMPNVSSDALVLVLYGDVPLISPETLQSLLTETHASAESCGGLALLTMKLDNPTGYGRIVRDDSGNILAIVEQKDASPEQLAINEVNTGILAASAQHFQRWLPQLSAENAQGEYYLTDVVALAVAEGTAVRAIHPADNIEVQGVNDKVQLSLLERVYQRQLADQLLRDGTSLADPDRIDIRGTLRVGRDVEIDIGCIFEGEVDLEDGVRIGPYCTISNSRIGAGSSIEAYSMLDQANVDSQCQVGPYARLRPGADIADGARVGNFVEIKKSRLGPGAKANHLTYLG